MDSTSRPLRSVDDRAPDEESAGARPLVCDLEPTTVIDPPKTLDSLVRLLAERGLPGRRGPLTWAWVIAVPILYLVAVVDFLNAEWGQFWWIVLALMTGRIVSNSTAAALDSRAALLLSELDNEWLGPLIDALAYAPGSLRSIARLRLTTLLPTLRAEDCAALTPGRRALLFGHLDPWYAYRQPDFISAIVRFGLVLGDEHALAGTDRLAGMRVFSAGQRCVREAARQCLPELEQRVTGMASSDPIQTLRAVDGEEEEAQVQRELGPEARAWLAEVDSGGRSRPGMRFGFLLASWLIIVPFLIYQMIAEFVNGHPLFGLVFGVLAASASQMYRFTMTPQQERLAAKLGSIDNVEAVGPITEMTSWPDMRIRGMAIAALTRLLPRMRATHTQLLTRDHRSLLYQWLKLEFAQRHAEFQLALLGALQQVGDTDAVPFVQMLARQQAHTIRQRKVVEAANQCLPFLESCAQNNSSSQLLLRAVTVESAEATLLRPMGRQAEVNPDLLVRTVAPSEPA